MRPVRARLFPVAVSASRGASDPDRLPERRGREAQAEPIVRRRGQVILDHRIAERVLGAAPAFALDPLVGSPLGDRV